MKKGLIIQGIKMKTSVSVFVSTLFYEFLASFFIEGALWLSRELVGPLYSQLLTLQFCIYSLALYFLGESNREKFLIKLRFCKKELAQVSRLGDLAFSSSNGCDCPCLPGGGNRDF